MKYILDCGSAEAPLEMKSADMKFGGYTTDMKFGGNTTDLGMSNCLCMPVGIQMKINCQIPNNRFTTELQQKNVEKS